MRSITFTATLALALSSSSVLAASAISHDRVKSGILPSGDLYSIYEVSCDNSNKTHIAMMDRRRSWCMIDSGSLECVRDPELAADQACAAQQFQLASDDKSLSADS